MNQPERRRNRNYDTAVYHHDNHHHHNDTRAAHAASAYGAKAPEPVFLFREGQPPLCRCKVRYGKQAA
ncbi:hypothetical protein C823_000572 [Eubacterium plexicaudatum ASF492]|nr:hypothetical protein C823_000572 [Eubacterium plexicaudatum ASF492]